MDERTRVVGEGSHVGGAALPYLRGITVTYKNGDKLYVSAQEIRDAWASGEAFSKQTDVDGKKYFRLNLLKTNAAGQPEASFGSSAEADQHARKDGIADYQDRKSVV